MHVLTVCYGHPADPAAFDSYYFSTHRPLAEKIPGLASFTARHCDSLDGSQPPYYLLAELSFASQEALDASFGSGGPAPCPWFPVSRDVRDRPVQNLAACQVQGRRGRPARGLPGRGQLRGQGPVSAGRAATARPGAGGAGDRA